jgi:hypothetical protein
MRRAAALSALWEPVERLWCGPEIAGHEAAQILAGSNGISVTVTAALGRNRPIAAVLRNIARLAAKEKAATAFVVHDAVLAWVDPHLRVLSNSAINDT